MALKHITRRFLNLGFLLAVLGSVLFNANSTLAMGNNTVHLPDFTVFSQAVQNGKADSLRGVYVPNVMALPIVQQPSGNAGYVSNNDGQATQFAMASQFGNIGLLAHNYLSGKSFSHLAVGQEVRLVYGDGRVEYFIVTEILQYQAMQPTSPWIWLLPILALLAGVALFGWWLLGRERPRRWPGTPALDAGATDAERQRIHDEVELLDG